MHDDGWPNETATLQALREWHSVVAGNPECVLQLSSQFLTLRKLATNTLQLPMRMCATRVGSLASRC